MPPAAANPFQALPPPPSGNDPAAQVDYLERVVQAFEQAGNPRLAPLKKRLHATLAEVARGAERGDDPEKLAREFAAQVAELRLQTYDLLSVVINQVRATLRVKLQGSLAPPERLDAESLQKGLGEYAQGLRKLILAIKKRDATLEAEAQKLISAANELLSAAGKQLGA